MSNTSTALPTQQEAACVPRSSVAYTPNKTALYEAVLSLAAEQPLFVYRAGAANACLYTATQENPCGCILGAAARRIGESFDNCIGPYEGRYDLSEIQLRQDKGYCWGKAVYASIPAADLHRFAFLVGQQDSNNKRATPGVARIFSPNAAHAATFYRGRLAGKAGNFA